MLEIAADCSLEVVPLVQTIGHMEFVLKHEQWKGLREVENYPSSMCPSNSETMQLVRGMIKQMVAFHPNIQYLHIGADEVAMETVKDQVSRQYFVSGLAFGAMFSLLQTCVF